MPLSQEQLQAIVERALPGARLADARELAPGCYALSSSSGERLCAQLYESAPAAETAAAALRMLRGEIDLPIPQLRASDPQGQTIGAPYLLLSELPGVPLAQAAAGLGDQQLYGLGRRLGEVCFRIHRLACERYGALAGDEPIRADDERGYGGARLEAELAQAQELIDQRTADELRAWFAQAFAPPGRAAALICGGLGPATIWVRRSESGWRLSGLLGWEHALGWSPAWEHATLFDAAGEQRYFSLRVGYGNSYDEQTSRPYEQVRERALSPYRALLALQHMRAAHAAGDSAAVERRCSSLRGLMSQT